MYKYILRQIQLTSHFLLGTITSTPERVTSLLPTLVQRFAGSILPIQSLLDCQAAQARLATSKLPQPRVDLIDVAATPAILLCCVCTTCRETQILVLAVLVRDCLSCVSIQKAGHQGDSANQIPGVSHAETGVWDG